MTTAYYKTLKTKHPLSYEHHYFELSLVDLDAVGLVGVTLLLQIKTIDFVIRRS